jgi:hypothetical protein
MEEGNLASWSDESLRITILAFGILEAILDAAAVGVEELAEDDMWRWRMDEVKACAWETLRLSGSSLVSRVRWRHGHPGAVSRRRSD